MLRSLTALRFPAALAVFLYHAPLTRDAAILFSTGYAGVGFFFLLSGFILTINYRGTFSLRRFYAARLARIYPVHLFAMAVALAALAVAGGGPEWSDAGLRERTVAVMLQAVLLQSWFPSAHVHFTGNGPAWSLSDEAFFYALFPFALAAIARVFRSAPAGTFLLAAAAVWALLAASLVGVNAPYDDWAIYVLPPARFIDFGVGILLANAYLAMAQEGRRTLSFTVAEGAALGGILAGAVLSTHVPQSLRFSAAMMPFSAAVIFVFALQRGAISRALGGRIAVRLGEASYAFYLLHRPVIEVTNLLLGDYPQAAFVCALAIAIALSLAVFAYVETPLRRRIREVLAPHPAGAAAQEAAIPAL